MYIFTWEIKQTVKLSYPVQQSVQQSVPQFGKFRMNIDTNGFAIIENDVL
jgi:hypothetical protein